MSNNDTRMKLILSAKESDGEIPLLSDLTADEGLDVTNYPVAFQIPYQYAVGVLKEVEEEPSTVMKFLQPLKTNPDPFYHNGCSFPTAADSLNALRAYAQMHLKTTSPDIRDVLRIGTVYEVSLVFRRVGTRTVRDLYTKEMVEYVREKMKEVGLSDREIMEFVRAEAKRDIDALTTESEDPPVKAKVPDDVDNVSTLYPIPLIGEDDNLLTCDKMLKSKTRAVKDMVDSFFTILKNNGDFDSGVNPDKRRFRSEILTYGLEDFLITSAWEVVVQQLSLQFSLTPTREDQLRHTPMATRVYQVLCFIRDNGVEM